MAKKNEPKKTEKKAKEEKQVLLDLVEQSPIKLYKLVMNLSNANLLKQYEEEKALRKLGVSIDPTITEKEFNKIMEE